MEFKERKETAARLSDDRCIDADRELLARFFPGHSLLRKAADGPGGDTLSYDIVYTLLTLGFVGEAVILNNRQEYSARFDSRPSTQNVPTESVEPTNDTTTAQIRSKSEEEPESEPQDPPVKKKMRSTRTSGGRSSIGKKSSGRS